jgi:hypothetical protein
MTEVSRAIRQIVKLRWIAITIFLLLILFGVSMLRNRVGPGVSGSPLLGNWTMPNPQGSDTTRILTLRDNGTLNSKDISDSSGAILQDSSASWWFENDTLILKKSWRTPEDRIPIKSLSNDKFRSGKIVYTRVSDN